MRRRTKAMKLLALSALLAAFVVVGCDDGGGGSGLDDGLGTDGETCPPYPEGSTPAFWSMNTTVPPSSFVSADGTFDLEEMWCKKAVKSLIFILGAPG